MFPSAEITGTDISPIQPAWVPPNVKFVIDDCLLEWTWPENHFDFVHMRALYGSITDWEELYRQAFRHLKPGGWFQNLESDVRIESDHVSFPPDHVFNTWAELLYKAGNTMGRSFTISQGHEMKELMEKVGFVDVVEKKFKVPLHGWPQDPRLKQAGMLAQLALDQSLDGFGMFLLTQVLGWTRDEAMVLVAKMRKESRKKLNYPWYWT
jgi:trans-aconitate methyltransferase